MNLLGKHLVIFGCGYVGGAVAREALQRGLRVTALTRNEATGVQLQRLGVTVIVDELSSEKWHLQIRSRADFVLNAVSSGGGGIESYRRSYVDGMRSVVQWAQRAPVGTFVYTSSTSVYPQGGGMLIDEDAPVGGSERGDILVEAEGLATSRGSSAHSTTTRSFVLRLAGIYGPQRHHLLDQVRLGEVAGRGEHRLNLIHRDDVCAAIWKCFEAPEKISGGTFNVADDGAATKAQVVNWLAREIGVPEPRFTGVPAHGRRAVVPDRVILNRRIKDVLGWMPQYADFRSGYKNMLAVGTD